MSRREEVTSALTPALSPRRGGIADSLSTISAGFHNRAREIRFMGRENHRPSPGETQGVGSANGLWIAGLIERPLAATL